MVVFSSFRHQNETKRNNNQRCCGKQRIVNEKSKRNNVSLAFFVVFNKTLRKKTISNINHLHDEREFDELIMVKSISDVAWPEAD